MVLDLPGGLFGQDDVRETATATVGTKILSISGTDFNAQNAETDNISHLGYGLGVSATAVFLTVGVNLPHGATVTSVIVTGNISDETWTLRRTITDKEQEAMATGNIGTEDTSITTPIIDNDIYHYYIATSGLDNGDTIYKVKIKYTT